MTSALDREYRAPRVPLRSESAPLLGPALMAGVVMTEHPVRGGPCR